MNKQRKVVITTTYNEMGIIIDTKAEELGSSAQPEPCEDTISRQAAIDELVKMLSDCFYADEEVLDAVKTTLKELPPALREQHHDEWCTNCKEYDHENSCCPRWTKVIRQTRRELQDEFVMTAVDGTLWVTVDDVQKVGRVIVDEDKSKFCRQFYMDREPEIGRWIPCSERLPEEDGIYRVTIDPDYLTPDMVPTEDLYWHEGKWKYCDIVHHPNRMPELKLFELEATVLAWKPLEEPYKEQRG